MPDILKYIIPSVGTFIAIVILALFSPEKVEKWWSLILRFLTAINQRWHRRQVTHDLQGRINEFVHRLGQTVPNLGAVKFKVDWVERGTARKSFFDEDKVVLRLRRDDPKDHNFIHGAYLFVSTSLLSKPKRYISPSQRDALDLFVCSKILESEKSHLVAVFVDEYLFRKTADAKSKTSSYIDDFVVIDNGGFFFPVFLQELEYLGDKVFGRRNDGTVISEVEGLVNFLKPIANRLIGQDNELNFPGSYCRFGIVLVGKPQKLMISVEPYVSYIGNQLVRKGVETIYLLGRPDNEKRIKEICDRFRENYYCERHVRLNRTLRYDNGATEKAKQLLVILRKSNLPIIRPSNT